VCGICGQFNFIDGKPVDQRVLSAMTASLAHRGPDDSGYLIDGPLGLGFRRLSIIDVDGGHQPMSDSQGSVWVAFNGEIYNFRELRDALVKKGHVFRTRSDTEVIVHGYKEWGNAVLTRLNGMFGVAIWDAARRKLLIARDAAGIKLVYYTVDRGTVTFGSEIRAVLEALPVKPSMNLMALNHFLRYRYTPSPHTLFNGVRKLAPGTMAVFEDGQWRVERWYQYRPQPLPVTMSDRDAAEELLAIYKRAVQRHLISDVPVGLLLSGGIDSGLLLGLMRLHGSNWPTYTVGYGQAVYKDDELTDAAETAAIYQSHNEQVLLSQSEFERNLPGIVKVLEEPVASSSIVPMYFVCQRARQDVKVALMGQGPDELFGGYARHLGVRYGACWRAVPTGLRHVVAGAAGHVRRAETLKRGLYSLDVTDQMSRFREVFSIVPGREVDGLFQDGQLPQDAGESIADIWGELRLEMESCDELGAFQVLEIRSSLPDELLMYADKLSMAHGLEVRVPYLDREVVEYAERLPARLKIRLGRQKWLHRQVCRGFLPQSVINRKKRGFAVDVVDNWFRESIGRKTIDYLVDPASRIFTVLRPEAVGRLLEAHRSGRHDNHKILFSLVVLEEWMRSFGT
jgi:asparagine synthase (glutamine-hydrolysing)